VQEGDSITIDATKNILRLNVDEKIIAQRRSAWKPRESKYTRGVMAKYAKLVSTSSLGAVTD